MRESVQWLSMPHAIESAIQCQTIDFMSDRRPDAILVEREVDELRCCQVGLVVSAEQEKPFFPSSGWICFDEILTCLGAVILLCSSMKCLRGTTLFSTRTAAHFPPPIRERTQQPKARCLSQHNVFPVLQLGPFAAELTDQHMRHFVGKRQAESVRLWHPTGDLWCCVSFESQK